MKTTLLLLLAAGSAAMLVGCSTHDKGPYLAQWPETPAYETREPVVLLDPGVQYSVTYSGVQSRTLEDGRLQVDIQLRNRENRRIEVQANCVFKDQNGFLDGDETPFQMVILTENATKGLTFTSMNDRAKKFTVRVRQAR